MVQQIWKDKGIPDGTINKDVTSEFAKRLWGGVTEGYGKPAKLFNEGKIDYTTPNFKMLTELQKNVWQFSSAKNYTQMRQISNALIGDNSKLRSFNEFKAAAGIINDAHTKQYLKTEYNLAVNGAQMAAKWVDIEEQADTLPYLQFDAVLDRQTTELCAGLDGTILPIHHPFWNTYYPPNHWNCRSTVRQLATGVVTPHDQIPSADIPPMFQTNLAKHELIYPKGSSYFIDKPENINGINALRNELRELAYKRVEGKIIKVEGIGEVHITRRGIRKCLTQNTASEFYNFKNNLVPLSISILENLHNIHLEDNLNDQSLKVWKANIKGLKYFKVVIKQEVHDGKIINALYSITGGK